MICALSGGGGPEPRVPSPLFPFDWRTVCGLRSLVPSNTSTLNNLLASLYDGRHEIRRRV
jgi:hypothetical protein